MKTWLRLTIITMTVGGGFTGFALTLPFLLKPQSHQLFSSIFIACFLALYAFVTASGLLFVLNPQRTLPLFISLGFQIPWISSPLIAYRFTAGLHITVGFVGGDFNGGFRLGSDWQFNLFQKSPWGLGVNLFAVTILALLARAVLTTNKAQLLTPIALASSGTPDNASSTPSSGAGG